MNSVCIIQADNRDPETFFLKKTMIVNKRAAERLNFDYKFIKFENEDGVHPATLKIKIINNLIKNNEYEIIIFTDSDAWIHDVINLSNIVNIFKNCDKHGCYSRELPPCNPEKEPHFFGRPPHPSLLNVVTDIHEHNSTYINSGVFLIKVNDYIKKMYNYLENQLINDQRYINWWPWDQYYISNFVYKNKNDFLILASNILNTPWGEVIRHNWLKDDNMYKDLDYLIENKIDINYNGNFKLENNIE